MEAPQVDPVEASPVADAAVAPEPQVDPVEASPVADAAVTPEPRAKRERKQTEMFSIDESSRDTKEIVIPSGAGVTLGSIPAFEEAVTKFRGDDEVIRSLHSLCFGAQGTKLNRKKNLRQFCGFSAETTAESIELKLIENKKKWSLTLLKEACDLLSLEKSGTREELCKRVVEYLSSPSTRTASSRVRGSSAKKAKGAKRKRSSKGGEPKAKRGPTGYILFSQANRELAKAENPSASFSDIGKILGVMWGGLSAEEKQTWNDAAAAGRAEDASDATESSDGEAEEPKADVVDEDEGTGIAFSNVNSPAADEAPPAVEDSAKVVEGETA